MNPSSEFLIDPRSEKELRAKLLQLAASYTPEWVPDEADPDVGLTAGLIFTSQMAGNLRRLNQVVEKYHTEFVNMLNLSLLPAYPAGGVAVLDLIQDTVPGIDVPAGTKLLAGAGDGEDLIFETCEDVHITNSRLREVWAVSGTQGRILPFLGEPAAPEIYPGEAPETPAPEKLAPFRLFDFHGEGSERNALMLYHRSAFDAAEGVELLMRLRFQGEDLSPKLADPAAYRWSWYGRDGLVPFDRVESRDGNLILRRSGESGRIRLEDGEYAMICLEALRPVTEPLLLDEIAVSSLCDAVPPAYVVNGTEELDPEKCLIFGTRISLLDECYIGHDSIFRQQGAEVTLRFRLACEEHLAALVPWQEEAELKVIKRKPRTVQMETASTAPQRVTLEYFNGTGWRQLPGTEEWAGLFDGEHGGEYGIRFLCPEDWQPVVVGGYEQRALRIKVVQADNCYFQPCVHRVPRLEGISLSYSFQGRWKSPQRIRRLSGASLTEQSGLPAPHAPLEAFAPLDWNGDGLCLGFDRPMSNGPVSILFDLREDTCTQPIPLQLEYSARDGFHPLKAIDHTHGMTRAGTILFLPPPDFARREIAGQNRYWLRLTDQRERPGGGPGPEIRAVIPNAVQIRNQETLPELSFSIEASAPNMSFALGVENILSAEVFVNERERLTMGAMQRMLRETPEDVRAEYDFLGDIQSFFVRWTEVDNFDSSHPGDRHYVIDRMTGTLRFGDGISVMIPPASRGTALTVSVVRCDGAKANLGPGAVHDTFGRLLYVNQVTNPIATYGGSSIESVESARLRGAGLINGRDRLVSEQDFIREIRAFSSAISKAKCVPGQDPDGRKDAHAMSVVLMMRDYAGGSYSFNSLRERLLARLAERCEAALLPEKIYLTEPAYVELTVDLWVEIQDPSRVFAVQNVLRESIAAFLDPLTGCGGRGWEVGVLPTDLQIRQHLQSIRCGGTVKQYIVTARYRDRDGAHERDLSTLPRTPFMIGVNGNHQIHPVSGGVRRGGLPC